MRSALVTALPDHLDVKIGLSGPNCLKLTAPEFHLVAIKEILLAEFVIYR